jgi:hypothetical protein
MSASQVRTIISGPYIFTWHYRLIGKTVALKPRVDDLALHRNSQMRRRLETATLPAKLLIQPDRQPRFNRVRMRLSLSVAEQSSYMSD